MDTKLKKSSRIISPIGVLIGIVLGYGALFLLFSTEYTKELNWAISRMLDDNSWKGPQWLLDAEYDSYHLQELLFAFTCVLGVLAFFSVFYAASHSGKLDEKGNIVLTKFDKAWTEFQIALLVVCIVCGVTLTSDFTNIFKHSAAVNFINIRFSHDVTEVYNKYGYSSGGNSATTEIFFIVGILYFFIMLAGALLILSLGRKIRAKQFWKSCIVIKCILKVYDVIVKAFEKSEKVQTTVIMAISICVVMPTAFVCLYTFFSYITYRYFDPSFSIIVSLIGCVVALGAIFSRVPRIMRQYEEVKKGVEEVKKGNLAYKIPIMEDNDIGRLGASINEISQASEIAVQNELKHQRMQTELITNVSHDLKTPLTSMLSYVDLLKKEGLNGENAEEYLRIIDEKTLRLKRLTEELFEAAKAASGEMNVELTELSLGALVSQAIGELEEKLSANDLEIIFQDNAENMHVIADGQLLWRVIENLLVNTSKYALRGSRVYIDIIPDDNSIALEIKNISKERLNISVDQLMERFTRGDSSRNTEGSGLGLSIARDLTKLLKGEFDIFIDGDLFKTRVSLPKVKPINPTGNKGNNVEYQEVETL